VSRDEVVRVFDIIRDNSPGNVPDIQALRVPVKRNLPTPLCFFFNSELDLMAKYALPEKIDILGACPQVRVTERLGEDSAWMLQVYHSWEDYRRRNPEYFY